MSEYQYYEFRAIDRPLTEIQKAKISALSSRSHVTSHTASFIYNYGEFRGSAENAFGLEGIDGYSLEPPVPPGLNQLSGGLKTFVRFLGIDEAYRIHVKLRLKGI